MADLTIAKNKIRARDSFALTEQYEANAAVTAGDTVELLGTGKVRRTANATAGIDGIVVATENKTADAAAGEFVTVVTFGDVVGFDDLVPGKLYYLSANAGKIADVAGDIAIGYAVNSETLRVMPALADRPS